VPAEYEIIEHPADVGFIARGRDLRQLFQNAAAALCALACDPDSLDEREERRIEAQGADDESLLFAWLAEILAISDAEQIFFRRVEVTRLEAGRIEGLARGERYDRQRHRAGTYIKAVTYHQLAVTRADDEWRATVYLDV
jgi:SHS2 domain-containing protein